MSKKKIYIGVVVILIIAASIYLLIGEEKPKEIENPLENTNETINVLSLVGGDIKAFEIEYEGEHERFLKSQGLWVHESKSAPLLQNKLAALESFLGNLVSEGNIEDGDKSSFGLLEPLYTLNVITESGNDYIMQLGDMTTDGVYYYMDIAGKGEIYFLPVVVFDILMGGYDDFINKGVILASEIDQLTKYEITVLHGDGEGFAAYVDFESETAKLLFPHEGRKASLNSIEEKVIAPIKNLEIAGYAGELDMFGDTLLSLGISSASGVKGLEVSDSNEEGYYFVRMTDSEAVFKIDSELIKPILELKSTDFIDKFIRLMRIDVVESIEIKADEIYILDNENGLGTDDGLAIYQAIISVTFDDIAKVDIRDEPAVEITFNTQEGEFTDKYYEYDDEFYFVEVIGIDSPVFVSREKIDYIINMLK